MSDTEQERADPATQPTVGQYRKDVETALELAGPRAAGLVAGFLIVVGALAGVLRGVDALLNGWRAFRGQKTEEKSINEPPGDRPTTVTLNKKES